jgi:hypothetical protein
MTSDDSRARDDTTSEDSRRSTMIVRALSIEDE